MTDPQAQGETRRSRRSLLAAAAGASAAAVVATLPAARVAEATNGQAISIGNYQTGTTVTQLDVTGDAAFYAYSSNNYALQGSSGTSNGVVGFSSGANGVYASTTAGNYQAVLATGSGTAIGVFGVSDTGIGVLGVSGPLAKPTAQADTGVFGFANQSSSAIGVRGGSGAGTGVLAEATTGTALQVNGKAKFKNSGRKPIAAGHSSLKVTLAGVTTSSYVVATLQTNRAGIYVQSAVPASGSFTIYLNRAVSATTYVGYLVIN